MVNTLRHYCLLFAVLALFPLTVTARQGAQPAPLSFDLVVLDRNGALLDDVRPDELTVLVDGQPRRVLDVKYVARGPGATEAASLHAAREPMVPAAAEPARTILLVVDQTMLQRGDEPALLRAANALLDRLGLADRVAVVRLPVVAATSLELTTDRPAVRENLRAVTGLQAGAPVRADNAEPVANQAQRADQETSALREQQTAATDAPPVSAPADEARTRESVIGVSGLLASLVPIPGRKVVILLSAGLPRSWSSVLRADDLRKVATAAAASRTVVYTLGLRPSRVDEAPPDISPFETVARMSGGAAMQVDRQPDRTMDRMVPALSSCYTVTLDAAASDRDGKPHVLKVDTSRKGATLRFASSLVATSAPEDSVIALGGTRPEAAAAPAAKSNPSRNTDSSKGRDDKGNDEELSLVLSRLIDYVEGYQRAFSAVVAEESYSQNISGTKTSTKSDLLLIRLGGGDTWESFRDVFEVDGLPVRDRDERLKKLFIDGASADLRKQLEAIKTESARYNIGLERNVNVPLFPLRIVGRDTRAGFRFSLGKTGETGGVRTRRIEFDEQQRPTMIVDRTGGGDVPLTGSFAVDIVTGAIVETVVEAVYGNTSCRFIVRYKRDDSLGFWVPSQMEESFRPTFVPRPGMSAGTGMEAQASYSHFRRFQVKTEEKVTVPKK